MTDTERKTEEHAEKVKKSIEEYGKAKFTGEISFTLRFYQGGVTAVGFLLKEDLN